MTDKVQKIKEFLIGMAGAACCDTKTKKIIEINILPFIDSLQKEPVSEELEDASRNYADDEEYGDDIYIAIKAAFKAGAKWQKEKDESTTEDLGMYINELSKQFPEVSFAKLSRIAVRVAKWQKEQMMSKAIDFIIVDNNAVSTEISTFPYVSLGTEGDTVKLIIINQD